MKIRSDMPLPTPRSVMSSASHITRPVPAVIVRIISRTVRTPSFATIGEAVPTAPQPPNNTPVRAVVTIVVACKTARKIVR